MIRKNYSVFILLLVLIGTVRGEILPGPGSKAHKNFDKGKFRQAKTLSYKAIKKDSLSPLGYYCLSRCLIYTPVPREIDSAHWAETIASRILRNLSPGDSMKILKKTGETFNLKDLREKIDFHAFHIATSLGQEASYQHFIDLYPNAPQWEDALLKRDSIAYEFALSEGSSFALNSFIEKYPGSKQANDAAKISELFLFKEKTRKGSWQSFRQFYLNHPKSNFVKEAHFKVFQLKTFQDNNRSYLNFIDSFPENIFLGKADTLYQFRSQNQLKNLLEIEEKNLVWNKYESLNTRFDSTLVIIIPDKEGQNITLLSSDSSLLGFPIIDSIPGKQVFSDLDDQWLISSTTGKFSLGHVFDSQTLKDLEDIHWRSPQWVQTRSKSGENVRHFMGFSFFKREFEKIKFAFPNLFFGKRHGSWNAYAPNGHQYNQRPFDTLFSWGNLILGQRDSLWLQFKSPEILSSGTFSNPHVYDFLNWSQGFLVTKSHRKKYLVDPISGSLVELSGGDKILNCPDGWLIENSGRFTLLGENWELKTTATFQDYKPLNFGFAWKPSKKWIVSNSDSILGIFDSVATYGSRFNQYWFGDSLYIHSANCLTKIDPSVKFIYLFTPGVSKDFFLLFDKGRVKEIQTPCGETLFSGSFEEAKALSPVLFRVKKKGLFGLLDTSGNYLLDLHYDYIFNPEKNVVLLFRNKKYEAYSIDTGLLLKKKYNNRPKISDQGILFSEEEKGLEWFSFDTEESGSIPNTLFEKQLNDSLILVSFPGDDRGLDIDSMGIYNLNSESFMDKGASKYFVMGKNHLAFTKNGFYGIINLISGKVILQALYEEIIHFRKNEKNFFFSILIPEQENNAFFQIWNAKGDLLNHTYSKIDNWYDQYY